MLEHGGQLRSAAARYGIPLEHWLDLSTGINPHPYPLTHVPLSAWARLPQEHDGLEDAAAACYGTHDLLPVAGSQAAIQALPRLRPRSIVGVLSPGYAEHAHAWRSAGHEVLELADHKIAASVDALDVLVVMQPNNPTGVLFAREQLHDWHERLSARGGWLIVDEAFIDATPQRSIVPLHMPIGLIVLRSLGKFFGLAGARVGFALAQHELLTRLREQLGPWGVMGPARHVAKAALRDVAWQEATRVRLTSDGERLAQLLRDANLPPAGGCALFQRVRSDTAQALHHALAQRGILTRHFDESRSLRFGLPATEAEWERLRAALSECAA